MSGPRVELREGPGEEQANALRAHLRETAASAGLVLDMPEESAAAFATLTDDAAIPTEVFDAIAVSLQILLRAEGGGDPEINTIKR